MQEKHKYWCMPGNKRCRMIRYIFRRLFFTGFNLLCDRQGMAFGKITGTSATAENAAAGSKCSIPVWTGHTAIERNLIELFTISSFQIIIERIISFFSPAYSHIRSVPLQHDLQRRQHVDQKLPEEYYFHLILHPEPDLR